MRYHIVGTLVTIAMIMILSENVSSENMDMMIMMLGLVSFVGSIFYLTRRVMKFFEE